MSYTARRWRRAKTNKNVTSTGFYISKTSVFPANSLHGPRVVRNVIWAGTNQILPLYQCRNFPDPVRLRSGFTMNTWLEPEPPFWAMSGVAK